ncbi:MAG: Uma2 family endonuclease [Methylococcaceae bacterium]|nr:Uma2 family endonuclease [Methylococcaceae bacterium]
MGLPQTHPSYGFDDYLAQEREGECRQEYLDGQVYAMAGETLEHSTICFNLAAILGAQLRGKPCRGLSPNMKVLSGKYSPGQIKGLFSYPDVSVVCGEPKFHDERRDVLLNPTLIIEVLSPGTELFDRGEKFRRYRTCLESLQDYVLVSSASPMVELFQRQAGGFWLYSAVTGLEARVALPSIGCELSLAEIYERLDFPAEA